MKKKIMIPLSVMAITLIITGCANTDSTVAVGKNLNTNLTNLSSIVCKLDTVDNSYIANPDLQQASKLLSYKNNSGASFSLATNSQVDNNQINDLIKQLLYNKLSERLTQNRNGNCKICNQHYSCDSDGFCNNCNNKIICDSYGNCTNCGQRLRLSNNNTCANCHNTAVISQSNCSKAVERLSKMQTGDIEATRLNAKQIVNSVKNNDNAVENNELVAQKLKYSDNQNENINYKEQRTTNSNTFEPHIVNEKYKFNNVRYNPRHYQDLDSFDISEQIDNYIAKIQKLYAMSSDTLEANTILSQCKTTLLDSVSEVKELNKAIINGTCTPSGQQIQALKNYIDEIKYTVKKLKNCNGDLTEQVKKINKSENANITTSVDVMNSNYMSILNQIDTRIAYHESAISTLEQIKYLLEDAIDSGKLSEEQLIKYNEELNNIQIQIDDEVTTEPKPDNQNELTDSTVTEEIKPVEDNNSQEDKIDESFDSQTTLENSSETDIKNKDIAKNQTNNASTQDDTQNLNNETASNTELTDTEQSPTSNIDTYKNDTVTKNVDTMINKKSSNENLDETDKNVDTQIENDNANNTQTNTNSKIEENSNVNSNTDVIDNNSSVNDNNMVDNTINNDIDATNSNVNKNQNNLKNGVIYQNNLNTGNNVQHRYYYGDDGKVHNTTDTIDNNYANQSANTNNAQFNANQNNTNNNVNTYGYNSMLDVINQGTVNNGINNL